MVSKTVPLPNIRELFIPDEGFKIYDIDLDQADAQVVAWEADDDELKRIFRDPDLDLHDENAKVIFGSTDPDKRQQAKSGVHGTNYGGSPYAIARALGIPVKDAKRFQDIWFEAHPKILEWHDRIEDELASTRSVSNKFGAKITFFDRSPNLFNEALAWIPQSTVGTVINKGILNVYRDLPDVELLLQVHDSSVGQYPLDWESNSNLLKLKQAYEIPIPYDDPLIISIGMKTSTESWGQCKDQPWPQAA
jgi:DNA polymerase I-like protein with 3'-5' exonuclease and polymerase domains